LEFQKFQLAPKFQIKKILQQSTSQS
jgi:hypothetical protein